MRAAFETLELARVPKGLTVTFNRPEAKNTITPALLAELDQVLDAAIADPEVAYVVLRGSGGSFCSGLDFASVAERGDQPNQTERYMRLLQKLASAPVIAIAAVDGRAMAGGVGIAAACDLVYATPDSEFMLTEALWGLLPCCVSPFLIRRVGYQRAYRMTLTTLPIDGRRAADWGLVDELADQPELAIRRAVPRLARLDPQTLADMKRFFGDMWLFDQAMAGRAVAETERLLAEPRILANLDGFVRRGVMPWQS